ncbi:MAG TPA: hypothetical protein PKA13_19590 [Geminicoccaceae bacterium]|nr:hypothetical protein [Geminicoccus sp.]HMU51989.1 hypothetical protein [Geminicoccaceae bacterium]
MRRRLLLGSVLAVVAAPALAAEPTGTWVLDRKAWAAFVADLVPKLLERMPEAQRQSLEDRGIDVADELRKGLSQGLEGSVELRPDGRVVALNGRKEPDGSGRWRRAGQDVEIDLPAERLLLRGTWRGDRMDLQPVLDKATLSARDADPLWLEAVRRVRFVLVRQG